MSDVEAPRKMVLGDLISDETEIPFLWWLRLTDQGRRIHAMVSSLYS